MAAPFVVGLIAGAAGSASSTFLAPLLREGAYQANYAFPNKLWDVPEVMELYINGDVNSQYLIQQAQYHGIRIGNLDVRSKNILTNIGGELGPYQDSQASSGETVSNKWLRQHLENPTNDEIVRLFYRKEINQVTARYLMKRNRQPDPNVQDLYFKLGLQIPGPSDLIRFAVREAFTPSIVTAYGYANETPMAILPWMEKQGLGGNIGISKPASVDVNGRPDPERPATWFDMYWWSHWELPSPTQGYEMAQRLYPNSNRGASPDWTPDIGFSSQDLSVLLRTLDYPLYWRKRLEAIAYLPLGRVDVRRMYAMELLDDNGVFHAYRQMGYNDRNAELLLKFAQKQKAEVNLKKQEVWTKQAIVKYYKYGVIREDTALDLLQRLGYTPTGAARLLQQVRNDLNIEKLENAIKVFHKGYLDGIYSDDGIRANLLNAGVLSDVVDNLITNWRLEKEFQYRNLTTNELLKMFANNVVDENELSRRLFNLGYQGREVTLIITSAKRDKEDKANAQLLRAVKAQAQELSKAAKDQARAARTLGQDQERARQAAARELRARQAATIKAQQESIKTLIAPYSEKNLIAMFRAEQLNNAQVTAILKMKGWNQAAIERWTATYIKPANGERVENED